MNLVIRGCGKVLDLGIRRRVAANSNSGVVSRENSDLAVKADSFRFEATLV